MIAQGYTTSLALIMAHDPAKNSGKVIEISYTSALIEYFMTRLLESNEVLEAALVRLRDRNLPGAQPLVVNKVLAQVATALENCGESKKGF